MGTNTAGGATLRRQKFKGGKHDKGEGGWENEFQGGFCKGMALQRNGPGHLGVSQRHVGRVLEENLRQVLDDKSSKEKTIRRGETTKDIGKQEITVAKRGAAGDAVANASPPPLSCGKIVASTIGQTGTSLQG